MKVFEETGQDTLFLRVLWVSGHRAHNADIITHMYSCVVASVHNGESAQRHGVHGRTNVTPQRPTLSSIEKSTEIATGDGVLYL